MNEEEQFENSEQNTSVFPYKLTQEDRIKGGRSKSIKKSIGAKLRVYNNPDLSCSNCKHRCFLYDSKEDKICHKGLVLNQIKDLARVSDPLPIFDEVFSCLGDLKLECLKDISSTDIDGRVLFSKKKMFVELLMEAYRLKFGKDVNIAFQKKVTHADIGALMRKHDN